MKKNRVIKASDYKYIHRGNLSEDQEQALLCKWIKENYPDILYTVDLAGIKLNQHQKRIMSTRCKKGHPDLIIQEWYKDKYCGLAIEFKKTDVKVSKTDGTLRKNDHLQKQYNYLMALQSRCYFAVFVSGLDNAKEVIKTYLAGGDLKKLYKIIFPKNQL